MYLEFTFHSVEIINSDRDGQIPSMDSFHVNELIKLSLQLEIKVALKVCKIKMHCVTLNCVRLLHRDKSKCHTDILKYVLSRPFHLN